jgi:hypothetical protein
VGWLQFDTVSGHRGVGSAVVMVLLAVSAPACGDTDDLAVCVAYERYLDVAATVRAADVSAATVAEAAEALDELQAAADQLRAAAQGENEAQTQAVQEAVAAVLQVLGPLDQGASVADVTGLVEDDVDTLDQADTDLREAFDPICTTPS